MRKVNFRNYLTGNILRSYRTSIINNPSHRLHLAKHSRIIRPRYGGFIGPPATINREPGQTWKGAATAVDLCAGVWLMEPPPNEPKALQPTYLLSS